MGSEANTDSIIGGFISCFKEDKALVDMESVIMINLLAQKFLRCALADTAQWIECGLQTKGLLV